MSFKLPEPSDTLRGLAVQGRQLHAQYMAVERAKQSAPTNAALGADLLDFFFDLSGYKRAIARVGKGIAYTSAAGKESDVRAAYDVWTQSVRSELQGISIVGKKAPREPNSHLLLSHFSTSQRYARLEIRLEHGVRFLEELADERLIANEELTVLRAHVTSERQHRLGLHPPAEPRPTNNWNLLGSGPRRWPDYEGRLERPQAAAGTHQCASPVQERCPGA